MLDLSKVSHEANPEVQPTPEEAMMKTSTALGVVLSLLTLTASAQQPPEQIVATDDFENGMGRWSTSDPEGTPKSWTIVEAPDDTAAPNHYLRVTRTSDYEPPHRSPHSVALLKDVQVGDFELKVRLQNTNVKAGAHRDLCLFWGYQDPAHFYYVHLGAKADPHSCQIFIVNDAPRTMITQQQTDHTPWTEGWHDVKIVRRVDSGLIEVYFDDMETPRMTARDKTFTWGQVGLGTFDDHGNFDDFNLQGTAAEK